MTNNTSVGWLPKKLRSNTLFYFPKKKINRKSIEDFHMYSTLFELMYKYNTYTKCVNESWNNIYHTIDQCQVIWKERDRKYNTRVHITCITCIFHCIIKWIRHKESILLHFKNKKKCNEKRRNVCRELKSEWESNTHQ